MTFDGFVTGIVVGAAALVMSAVPSLAGQMPEPPRPTAADVAQTPLPHDPSMSAMDPYFTALNYPIPQDTMMVMLLADYQSARSTNDFFTGMGMVQYGITARWTVGFMVEGQAIVGLPVTYGGLRINSYVRVLPHDHLVNFTLYGEAGSAADVLVSTVGLRARDDRGAGNADQFGFDWQRQQHYVGPVFSYTLSPHWTAHVGSAFGLSDVSDPFVLRLGVGYSVGHLLHRRSPTP